MENQKPNWDTIDRCGIGVFSTGPDDPFATDCTAHDEAFLKGGSTDEFLKAQAAFLKSIWHKAEADATLIPRALAYTAIVLPLAQLWWRSYDRTKGEQPPPAPVGEIRGDDQ